MSPSIAGGEGPHRPAANRLPPGLRAWIASAVAGSALFGAPAAHAQPELRVRAESRIELRTVRHDDFAEIHGTLRDDLGAPLADRRVTLRAEPGGLHDPSLLRGLRTARDGSFRSRVPLLDDAARIRATFEGDALHDRVEVERRMHPSRRDVRLQVAVGTRGRLDLDLPEHPFEVAASSGRGGDALQIVLLDELDRELARGTTDAHGLVAFVVSSDDLGPPGAGRVKARSQADADRSEAQTEVPVVRFLATRLTLTVATPRSRQGEPTHFSGHLTDSRGPLPERAVGLFADGAHIGTVLTDSEGRFAAGPVLPETESGHVAVIARFESDSPGRLSSESLPLRIQIGDGGGWGSAPWLALTIALCTLLLVMLRLRGRSRRSAPESAGTSRPAAISADGRRGLRSDQRCVAGRVVDRATGRALAAAVVRLEGESPMTLASDGDGAFSSAPLSAGRYLVRASLAGYAESMAEVTVPHRGEWLHTQIRLDSYRQIAEDHFRPIAERELPSPRSWPVWTNREVLARARRKRSETRALADLVESLDQICYGADDPGPAELQSFVVGTARADQEGRGDGAPAAPVRGRDGAIE